MKRNTWILLILIFLVACSQPANPVVTPQQTETVTTATTAATPENNPISTATVAAQPSPTQTPTSVPPQNSSECVKISTTRTAMSPGVLVFLNDQSKRLTLLDSGTGKQIKLPQAPDLKAIHAYVSPDGKSLLYQIDFGDPYGETKLILAGSNGVQQKEMPFNSIWGISSRIYWLNNQLLRVAEMDVANRAINIFSFDPSTETTLPLKSNFPGVVGNENTEWQIDRGPQDMGMLKNTNILYDPTLKRVLYPKNDQVVSLYNLETEREVAQTPIVNWGRVPKWSPDGKYVTILSTSNKSGAAEEFLIASRDGAEFRQLTDLTSTYPNARIEDYYWSPDGKQIAFWMNVSGSDPNVVQNPFILGILDVQTGNTANYCLSGITVIQYANYGRFAPMFWSPDSAQVVITRINDENRGLVDLVLVDPAKKAAFIVNQNTEPIGWMIATP